MHIPDGLMHLPTVIELTREGADLSEYLKLMECYRTQLGAALSTFGLATETLLEIAKTIANDDDDFGEDDEDVEIEVRQKSVRELREIAIRCGIQGRSRMAKAELADAICAYLIPFGGLNV